MNAMNPSGADFLRAILVAGDRVGAARDELCSLDAVAGDGDLGATLATGFAHVRAALQDGDGDIGATLVTVGRELATKAPSTIGALLATAFMRAGKELAGTRELSAAGVATMLEVAAGGVAERGRAEPGQRTVLDAMLPAATAARAAADRGDGAIAALAAAAAAAGDGARATAGMEPRLGRAGWIADRARGHRDAGATAWAVFLTGLHDGLAALPAAVVSP